MDIEIWTEKYRPEKLNQIVNQRHIMERLKAFVERGNVQNMIFSGPAGCGKTTAAVCIAKEFYSDSWRQNFLEMNSSDERGIDVIRHKVKDFARTKSISAPYKIICLDEADALTQEAQQALRRTMENYTKTCRFILICNYSSRIIDPIESRCAVFRFKALEEKDVKKALEDIAKKEKLKIEEKAYDAIYYLSEGDMRKAINILQSAASLGKITEKNIYEVVAQARPSDVKEMISSALSGKFSEARKLLLDMLLKQGISGEDIIKEISRQIYEVDGVPERSKIEMIEKIGECEFRLNQGGNELIQIEALLANFMLFSKQNNKKE